MELLFALTLFTSAALLFLVEPMFAKLLLPLLGGTPAVWNTCLVFYQAMLLLGYVYAHFATRVLGPRRQALFHLALLFLPWLVLPFGVSRAWLPPADANPIPWLLGQLTVGVGLPLLVISASAPMLQAWFADTGHRDAKDPYFLYAASNLGSLLALLAYPLLIEPHLTLAVQARAWTAGFGVLVLLTMACAVALWRRPRPERLAAAAGEFTCAADGSPEEARAGCPSLRTRLRWLALSFAPSSLLLGVTAHISTDIAAMPLLWIIPLALYLLTFVVAFARRPLLPHAVTLWLQAVAVLVLAACFAVSPRTMLWSAVLLHLGTFFLTALVCHGELARSRPHASRLTEFYLWISVGGVLGGAFNALLAPLLFPIVIEYPLVLIVACMLRPRLPTAKSSWRENGLDLGLPMALALAMGSLALLLDRCQVQPDWLARMGTALLLPVSATLALLFVRRPARFALGVAAVLIVGCVHTQSWPDFVGRNFFGVVRVRCNRDYTELLHGTTSHGIQSRDPTLRDVPMTYYHRSGPLGQVIRAMDAQRPPRQLGVIGLGTGTIAAYGRPGERITFYEIDPIVERLARDDRWFTYLRDSRAKVDVVLGDARLSLERAPRGGYDLLVVDAFSSDAIPLHLLTREALRLYFDKLADDGVLAVHITNRYLNLAPIVARLAEDARLVCRDRSDDTRNAQVYASHWVMLSRHGGSLARLTADPGWQTTSAPPGTPLWTDDFSNILSAVGR